MAIDIYQESLSLKCVCVTVSYKLYSDRYMSALWSYLLKIMEIIGAPPSHKKYQQFFVKNQQKMYVT